MAERPPGEPVSSLLPPRPTIRKVRDATADCRACDRYKRGTQTVFGEGPARAEVMLVGEQPGDAEDVAGHPFVGPAPDEDTRRREMRAFVADLAAVAKTLDTRSRS